MSLGIVTHISEVFGDEEKHIEEGTCFHEDICFESAWCMEYLKLSGDKNISLHSASGKRIVQGMAILTKMGAFVSKKIPNHLVVGIDVIKFKKPISMGDTVTMALRITQVGNVRVLAEFTLYKDEADVLMQVPIKLVHQKILD